MRVAFLIVLGLLPLTSWGQPTISTLSTENRPVGIYPFGPLTIPAGAVKAWITVDRQDLRGKPGASLRVIGEVMNQDLVVLQRFSCHVPGGEYRPHGGVVSLENASCFVLLAAEKWAIRGSVEVIDQSLLTGAEVHYEIP
jgi:hypothetical protein